MGDGVRRPAGDGGLSGAQRKNPANPSRTTIQTRSVSIRVTASFAGMVLFRKKDKYTAEESQRQDYIKESRDLPIGSLRFVAERSRRDPGAGARPRERPAADFAERGGWCRAGDQARGAGRAAAVGSDELLLRPPIPLCANSTRVPTRSSKGFGLPPVQQPFLFLVWMRGESSGRSIHPIRACRTNTSSTRSFRACSFSRASGRCPLPGEQLRAYREWSRLLPVQETAARERLTRGFEAHRFDARPNAAGAALPSAARRRIWP